MCKWNFANYLVSVIKQGRSLTKKARNNYCREDTFQKWFGAIIKKLNRIILLNYSDKFLKR